ncbi:hypothetical protein DL96DRAFT_1605527 [Flagelloscypha sp. PMI_526]|nr:hypothetical protein DL96DRAFT_1605527 [Flagelloscypha sp. PMI_526]
MSDAHSRLTQRARLEEAIKTRQALAKAYLAKLEAELIDIRVQCNSCTAIYLLPDELLAFIFLIHRDLTLATLSLHMRSRRFISSRQLHGQSELAYCNDFVPWIGPSQVSRRWRRVAIQFPALWDIFYLQSQPWTLEFLRRSQHTSLHLSLPRHDEDWDNGFLSPLRPRLPPWKVVALQAADRVARLAIFADSFCTELTPNPEAFPNLHHLTITNRHEPDSLMWSSSGNLRLQEILNRNVQQLSFLKVDGFQSDVLTGLSIAGLEELHIDNCRNFGPAECLHILRHLPALRICAFNEITHKSDSIDISQRLLEKIVCPTGLSLQLETNRTLRDMSEPLNALYVSFRTFLNERLPDLITQKNLGRKFRSLVVSSTETSFGFTFSSHPDLVKIPELQAGEPSNITYPNINVCPPSCTSQNDFTFALCTVAFLSILWDVIGECCESLESITLDVDSGELETLSNLRYLNMGIKDAKLGQLLFDALDGFGFGKLKTLTLKSLNFSDSYRSSETGLGSKPLVPRATIKPPSHTHPYISHGSTSPRLFAYAAPEHMTSKPSSPYTYPTGPAFPSFFPLRQGKSFSGPFHQSCTS